MKYLSAIVFFLSLSFAANAQRLVKWMTMEQAIARSKVEKKKIFVDVYTDWCGWCKRMDKTTFNTPEVARILNKEYYPVKFNAEQRQTLKFKDKDYKYVRQGRGGYHEFAAYLLGSRMSYPTIVFLDEDMNIIQAIPGYRKKKEFAKIAKYFGEDFHKKIPWEVYSKRNK